MKQVRYVSGSKCLLPRALQNGSPSDMTDFFSVKMTVFHFDFNRVLVSKCICYMHFGTKFNGAEFRVL